MVLRSNQTSQDVFFFLKIVILWKFVQCEIIVSEALGSVSPNLTNNRWKILEKNVYVLNMYNVFLIIISLNNIT
jgi:hypothetical protein